MSFNIEIESGTSVRLPTGGKYCDRDIVVTAIGNTDNSAEDGIVTRTSTEYTNDRIKSIGQYAFYRNSSLESVNFPLVTTINQYAFGYCTKLKDIDFPSLRTLGSYAFQNCSLKSVEFPSLTKMNTAPFTGCSALTSIILPGSTICELGSSNSLSGTPIANGTGFVYVPDELVDSYKAATNWSKHAAQIKPISELEE